MPTAIARIYTHEGFVIAADGRKFNGQTRQVASDNEQKIFQLQHRSGQLSCTFAGVMQITHEDGSIAFDFLIETAKSASSIGTKKLKSLYHFTESLMEGIDASFEACWALC